MMIPLRGAVAALALLALAAASAPAQLYNGGIGYGVGAVWFSPFNPGSDGSTVDLGPGWVLTAHVDQWMEGGRLGGRLGGAFSQRPLDGTRERRDINVWMLDASALLRVLPLDPERSLVPFASAGVGVVSYDLGDGLPVVIPDAGTVYPGEEELQPAGTLSVGVDLLPGLSWHEVPLGVRVELVDRITRESPFTRIGGGAYGPVHNVMLTLSIQGLR